jgi:hypothetical protein
MQRRFCVYNFILLFVIATIVAQSAKATDELNEAKFQELHQSLQTSTDEPWRQIPWKISLLEAQNIAAKSEKPIFIWAMDGHPLGCT